MDRPTTTEGTLDNQPKDFLNISGEKNAGPKPKCSHVCRIHPPPKYDSRIDKHEARSARKSSKRKLGEEGKKEGGEKPGALTGERRCSHVCEEHPKRSEAELKLADMRAEHRRKKGAKKAMTKLSGASGTPCPAGPTPKTTVPAPIPRTAVPAPIPKTTVPAPIPRTAVPVPSPRNQVPTLPGKPSQEQLPIKGATDALKISEASTSGATTTMTFENYAMPNKSNGLCLIILNTKFFKSKKLELEVGFEESLRKAFKRFNFRVVIYKDLICSDLMVRLKQTVDACHSNMLMCLFSSHGEEGYMTTSDEQKVTINKIIELFNSDDCKGLAGKPKVFLFDCCNGKATQSNKSVKIKNWHRREIWAPVMFTNLNKTQDCFLGLATLPGCVARGYIFFAAVIKVLNKIDDKIEMSRFELAVNKEVEEIIKANKLLANKNYLQTPHWTHTAKKIFTLYRNPPGTQEE